MNIEQVLNKQLDKKLGEIAAGINANMALMPEGEIKEFFKESIKQSNDRKTPLDTKVFIDNLNKMTKDAS